MPENVKHDTPSRIDPIILTLNLILKNSTKPITLYTPDSFVKPKQIYQSGFLLIDPDTGKYTEPGMVICGLRAMKPITVNPNTDLFTLHPNVPTQTNILFGIGLGRGAPHQPDFKDLTLSATNSCALCRLIQTKLLESNLYGRVVDEEKEDPIICNVWNWYDGPEEEYKGSATIVFSGISSKRSCILGVAADEDTLPAVTNIISGRKAQVTSNSERCFDLTRQWINSCLTKHAFSCPHDPAVSLPTRVIDVGSALDSSKVRVYETKGANGVDESSRMQDYYSKAILTTASNLATGDHESFLDNERAKIASVKVSFNAETVRSASHVYISEAVNIPGLASDETALSVRGWTLQEDILSPRSLHYTPTELAVNGRGEKQVKYQAPSWSWAALYLYFHWGKEANPNFEIYLQTGNWLKDPDSGQNAEAISCEIETMNGDPFAPVLSGKLSLRGYMLLLAEWQGTTTPHTNEFWHLVKSRQRGTRPAVLGIRGPKSADQLICDFDVTFEDDPSDSGDGDGDDPEGVLTDESDYAEGWDYEKEWQPERYGSNIVMF
ncbi:hypothetical protein G7Y89_g10367 [Cudoniella acicularis]|uniref:Uncharacterized protein n=1 Tax=Cudoniella acicularis TaxID=354080 RepID=A0A8H4RCY2_9HELO|nr:hypothetical protein G7Y89_g10367 [Cudoniella acicularis]